MVFPEAYVPGYPVWIWRLRPEADYELTSAIHRELLANSVDLVADGLRPLRDAAAELGVVVVCGIPGREQLFPDQDEWLNPGDSVVVAPGGEIVAGPLHEEHGLLFADVEPARVAAAHRTLDVAGHYSRNDIFHLTINRTVSRPVIYQPAQQI